MKSNRVIEAKSLIEMCNLHISNSSLDTLKKVSYDNFIKGWQALSSTSTAFNADVVEVSEYNGIIMMSLCQSDSALGISERVG